MHSVTLYICVTSNTNKQDNQRVEIRIFVLRATAH